MICKYCERLLMRSVCGNIVMMVHMDYSHRCWQQELTEAWQKDRAAA